MKYICRQVARRLSEIIICFSAGAIGSVALAGDIVISQIYGAGGELRSSFRNDYVELFNRSGDAVSLSGWCLQYAPAAGDFSLGNDQTTALTGVIPAGSYYLVQLGGGTAGTRDLPTPDATGLTSLDPSNGKLALLSSCATAFSPAEPIVGGRLVDLVGFGTASRFEGNPANSFGSYAGPRAQAGCQAVDTTTVGFSNGLPSPRNSLSAQQLQCAATNAPLVQSCPKDGAILAAGAGAARLFAARDMDGLVTAASITGGSQPGIALTSFTPATQVGARAEAILTIARTLPAGLYPVTVTFSNNEPTPQTARCAITVDVSASRSTNTRIRFIQGTAHISPQLGQWVTAVPGVVTELRPDGFYMQDWEPDRSNATSEGIFVFTVSAPTVRVGHRVHVTGTVEEVRRFFGARPEGGNILDSLTTTQIASSSVLVLSRGSALPAPIVLGQNGRLPPGEIIDNDANGGVEVSGTFDPAEDGIDFYESLEGMRVRVDAPRAVGPYRFGELPVVTGTGTVIPRTARGGVHVQAADFNPERVILNAQIAAIPPVNVGATAPAATGIMDYTFGNYKLLVTSTPAFVDGSLTPEAANEAPDSSWLSVASVQAEYLHGPEKFVALARQIILNLRSPDVIAITRIQDDNGEQNDAVVDASQTYEMLIATIQGWGGPTYQYRQIDPIDNQDGGWEGTNERVAYLFNPQRVTFVDRPGGTSTSGTSAVAGPYGLQLSASPGRIDPTHPAFEASAKPLAAEILFNGHKLFLIANHFTSKREDQPLFGRFQPLRNSSDAQRIQQANVVAQFVQALHADPSARVIVLGGFNDFEFSSTLQILKNAGLVNLVDELPQNERYNQILDGNSQALDHILISQSLAEQAQPDFDIVHTNSEFTMREYDRDPELVRLHLPARDVLGPVAP